MPTACMDFLARKRKAPPVPMYVIAGDEPFLCRQAHLAIRLQIVGPEPDDFTYVTYSGDDASLRDVLDDLRTPPMLGDRRLVVVADADQFVSNHREPLLSYLEAPCEQGILLLEVKRWPSNTKLAKAVEQSGLAIEASAPKPWHTPAWCVRWCSLRYGAKLDKPTAEWLVELVGATLGQLDQELFKLTNYVGEGGVIDRKTVSLLAAGTHTENVFKLMDAALEGRLDAALSMLDRQLLAGDTPVMILAVMASQLRKLARAARDVIAGQSMRQAILDAKFPPFAVEKAEQQMRRLGRERMLAMLRLLLRADLDLKGGTGLEPRTVLERLLLNLSTLA